MSYQFLIVDDSHIVRKVIIKTLGMTSLPTGTIFEAENGQAALDILGKNWVDLIFLDINMPVMNGMEFMEKLRADANLKDLPVVVVSTEGSQERRARLEELKIEAYLRKPATPEAISEIVARVLQGESR